MQNMKTAEKSNLRQMNTRKCSFLLSRALAGSSSLSHTDDADVKEK